MTVTILWVCAAIAAAVFAVMIYSVATFRAPAVGPGPSPRAAPGKIVREIIWLIVPIMILVGMAVPAVRTLVTIQDGGNTTHHVHRYNAPQSSRSSL